MAVEVALLRHANFAVPRLAGELARKGQIVLFGMLAGEREVSG
jgi:hypothetical protein